MSESTEPRASKLAEAVNKIYSIVSEIRQTQAVQGEKITSIDKRVDDLASCYKVLNEHHIDTEKDLNVVKMDGIHLNGEIKEIKNSIKELKIDHSATNNKIDTLETKLDTIKNTILIALTITGGVIGIVIFALEYVFK